MVEVIEPPVHGDRKDDQAGKGPRLPQGRPRFSTWIYLAIFLALLVQIVFLWRGVETNTIEYSTFLDYGIPLAEDMPEPVLQDTETLSPTNPLQAKGAGEITTTGTAVVIVNAVVNALSHLGVRHIDIPLTPEKVWRLIHEGETQ